jgi:hypothetical protein
MASDNTFLAAALAAAEHGWHVFPVRPGDKRPAVSDWENRATVDPARIERCWTSGPYNIGIACGPSGLAVVDLDTPKPGNDTPPERWRVDGVHDGADVFALVCERDGAGDWPVDTYTVDTPRGGTHLYYAHPDAEPLLRNTSGDAGNGLGWLIDTRAHGGYVLGAGSVVNGRPYAVAHDTGVMPLPGWLAARLAPAPLPAQEPVTVSLGTGRRAAYLEAAIARNVDAVRTATAGGRNRTLYIAAIALGQLVAGRELSVYDAGGALRAAALAAGLTRAETDRAIRSGFRAGANRPRSVTA